MQRLVSIVLGCSFAASVNGATSLHVPPEFIVEKAAVEPEVRFPMFATFDDRGRLFVAESSGLDLYAELSARTRACRIRMLEDADGDGVFERSTIFAERLVFPMGLVWHGGRLFVADPPDLLALEDSDGDGHADKRTVILSGFGHRDNGSLHGLTFGPDGRLYMTMGEPDGYRLKRDDGSAIEGNSGALIRCEADGSNPEVLCRGFVNLVEVVFTASGEIIGTDNWFQKPSGGMRDALVHLVEGGLYPYIADNGSPKPITGRSLPAVAMFPAAALSGLTAYRGQTFPETMRGDIFSAQHNTRKIVRHVLQHEGSTFRAESFDFLTTDDPDVHFSDVLEDADGSLLAVDTGSWYVQHCPTGRIRKSTATGGIYRIRAKGAVPPKDPWGLAEAWTDLPTARLVELLADERAMVRDRAQRVFNARGEKATAALTSFLTGKAPRTARQAALWVVAAGKDPSAGETARALLKDDDPELAATAARVVGLRHDSMARSALHELLRSADLHVQRAATEALAECGSPDTVTHLWRQLAETGDAFLEHALVYAAHRLADANALQTALAEPNARVQRAALQLLAQPPRPASALKPEVVLARVAAPDAELRRTALTLLRSRREWSAQAVQLVSVWLDQLAAGRSIEEPAFRDLVVTFQDSNELQKSLAAALTERRPESRRLILETISQCTLDAPPIIWKDPVAACITDADPVIRARAIRAAIVLGFGGLRQQVLERAEDSKETIAVRLEAARLSAQQQQLSTAVFDFLISQLGAAKDPVSRMIAAERLGQSQLSDLQLCDAIQAMQKQQLIAPSRLLSTLNQSTSERASIALLAAIDKAMDNGWRPAEAELAAFVERLPAAVRQRAEPLKQRARRDLEGERAILAKFSRLLEGGNAETGQAVFFGGHAGCYLCHAVGNEGGRFGPDLTKIGAIRSAPDILEAVVLPSASFAQGYQSYAVTTADGGQISGIIMDQDAENLSLRDPAGGDHRFRTAQIKTVRPLPVSFMPEGVATALSEQEFRDLLAFLQQLK